MAISLSQGLRNSVYALGDITSQIDVANKRLATGRKINTALDGAGAYFRSEGYRKDSRDLQGLLDSYNTALNAINKTNETYTGIRKLVESAQALARQAANLGSTDAQRNELGKQAAELLTQASRLASDANFGGIDLLQQGAVTTGLGTTVITNISTGTAQTSVTVAARDTRFGVATGLASGGAVAAEKNLASANNGFTVAAGANDSELVTYTATAADQWNDATNGTARLTAFINFTQNVLNGIQAAASIVSTQASTIQIRQDFTKAWARTASEAADFLVLADINEEGANLTALQTKQQLSVTALSLAGRSDQAILRLF
jgi:flagellin-like hook-associated protein FlgL